MLNWDVTQRRLLVILSSAALFLGSGCTKVKFAYNHLDWVVLPKLKSYTSFTVEQKKMIDQEFYGYMRWHRREMLPSYARLLRLTAKELGRPVSFSLSDAKALRLEFQKNSENTFDPFFRATGRVVVTLTDEQIQLLEKKFQQEDLKFKERYVDAPIAKQVERRERNILDIIEVFSGELSPDQQRSLQSEIGKFPQISINWLESRRRWRKELNQLLRSKSSAKDIELFLHRWFIEKAWMNTPQLKKFNLDAELAADRLVLVINQVLKDNQRRKAQKMLLDFAKDFEELSVENRD